MRQRFRARDRLNPGGFFCQWLPLYQLTQEEFAIIAATFQDLFPDALLFRGDFYADHPIVALIGSREGTLSAPKIMRAAARLERAGWVSWRGYGGSSQRGPPGP